MAKLTKPIIGYCGALTARRLNIELLTQIAETRPYWNMVFVGTECEEFKRSALHQMPNVHFLGQKNTKDLPGYIQHFDVCINPQLINDLTKDNYPLKIDEYLAMGKPVVATATETMKEIFNRYTYLCDSYDAYIGNIERALAEDNDGLRQARIEFARSHSWENVTREFIQAIKKINV
jgi:teichuronic acid biosynthesis glycosyltransferase TuaH